MNTQDRANRPPDAANPQLWRMFDWRFLISDPRLGRVWPAAEYGAEVDALEAVGVDVAQDIGQAVDTVLVEAASFDVPAVEQAVAPGTLVRIAVGAHGSGSPHTRIRPLVSWRRTLEGRDWDVLSCACAIPRLGWTRAYVELGNRRAVSHALSLVSNPRGVVARLKFRALLAIVRVGGQRLVCREGVILARTPA